MKVLRKTRHRETNDTIRDSGKQRHVVVSVDPQTALVSFRLKGTRRTYGLPASYLYMHALRKQVALDKADKAKAKKHGRVSVRRGALAV